MAELETPMGLALLICDTLIEDRHSGKKTLVGLFNGIQGLRYPCIHPQMTVFVSLTSGRGEYPCEVVCRHSDGDAVAFDAKGKVILRNPSQVVDLVFKLAGVRFPKPGKYWVQFLADGVPIMMRPIVARETRRSPAEAETGVPPPEPPPTEP